jgi:hypothetical protein
VDLAVAAVTAPMILRLEDGTVLEDPDEEQISALLDFLRAPDNTFAVLTLGEWTYLRAERDPVHRFLLRRCQGRPEERFRTVSNRLELDAVRDAFLAFAQGDRDWQDRLEWQPDFYSVLADPESPHYERLRSAARTLLLQLVQISGRPPTAIPWKRVEPLAERMARRVARELAEEEERFRPYREELHRDVRAAILKLLGSFEETSTP